MNTNEKTRNVLIAVDVQNDFINGSLAVREGYQVVAPINELAETVRESGGAAIFTRDWHPAATPHFDTWPVHCVADTEGAEFHQKRTTLRECTEREEEESSLSMLSS